MSDKPSKVETIKESSQFLRGNLVEELTDSNEFVSDDSYELLKFHGSYQGYDRDTATERKKQGLDKEWEFMVRMVAPAGVLKPEQYLKLDKICEQYANNTLRITTRETFQFHCIVKNNLKKHIAAINETLIDTLGGCGDVVRNVTCSPAPIKDQKHQKLLEDTYAIAKFCKPTTSSYHEIWLNGENIASKSEKDKEDLYGTTYLPRKFKIGLAFPEDNSIDALTHDIGIFPIYEGENLSGYNIYIGGGMGMTHNKKDTYPRLASPLAFIEPQDLLSAVSAIIKLQRDHGDRTNRKHARLKYVVEEKGKEWTKKTFTKYFGKETQDVKDMGELGYVDHMGWHEQKDGKWYLGIPIPSGRIIDREEEKIRTGLRNVIKQFNLTSILTPDQNIILCDIEEKDKNDITKIIKEHNIKLIEDISRLERNTLACVALPTCGKALAEAERIQIPLIKEFDATTEKHGIENEELSLRIAGCPNGCSRPYVSDIGIVGRMPGHYAIFIGGNYAGTRLNQKILDRVPYEHLNELYDFLLDLFVTNRKDKQPFGNFVTEYGIDKISTHISDTLGEKYKWAKAA